MSAVRHDPPLVPDVRELREAGREPKWQDMEDRLVRAFAARDAASSSPATGQEAAPRLPQRWIGANTWRWTAAAAVVVLAAAITFYPPPARHGIALPKPAEPAAPIKEPTTTAEPPRAPPRAPDAPARPRNRASRTAPAPAPARAEPASMARYDDFVALPGAFALPDFESGRIVRMEVPLANLPAYGLDMVPDAAGVPVEADFLIGQDGVARAIRLASARQ